MHDEGVGLAIRAVRQRRGLRQVDVAATAGVAQSVVSAIERGRLESSSLAVLRRVAGASGVGLQLAPRWSGGDLGRLLDAAHAALVEHVVAILRASGWEVVVEYSFNHFGERGSVDVVAWHRMARALLIVEVKSRLIDVQDLLATLGRKVRIVPALLARERGWRPDMVGHVVAVPSSHGARSVLARHSSTFGAALPARTRAVRAWLAEPSGPLAGIWLLPDIAGTARTRKRVRIRQAAAASFEPAGPTRA